MTERLYYTDSERLSFDADVLECVGDDRHVVLDRTAFYPTSGGQPHDTGRLGAARVVDVIDDTDRIVHVLDRAIGLGAVHGDVDADRRRDHMQQHSAQHLLSALAADRFGWSTESVHFGPEHSTIEFGVAAVSAADLSSLESAANLIVAESREVTVSFEDSVVVAATLRKPSERRGEIRVITIAGVDRSACGGTHVSRTSAIGAIALTGTERVRGRVRVAFVAGGRTIAALHRRDEMLASIARAADCAVDELGTLLPRRFDEARRLAARVDVLERELAAARVATLIAAQAPADGGVQHVILRGSDEPPSMLRAMAQAAALQSRLVFVATATTSPTVYFTAGPDTGLDAGQLLKRALASCDGRGGGSARVAQGTLPGHDKVDVVIDQLMRVSARPSGDVHDA